MTGNFTDESANSLMTLLKEKFIKTKFLLFKNLKDLQAQDINQEVKILPF